MAALRTLLSLVILLAMVATGALFTLQNTTVVPLDLLLVQLPGRTMSLWLLLALVLGVLLGFVAGGFLLLRQRAQLSVLRRQKERLALEIDRLRKVGLTDSE